MSGERERERERKEREREREERREREREKERERKPRVAAGSPDSLWLESLHRETTAMRSIDYLKMYRQRSAGGRDKWTLGVVTWWKITLPT